MRLRPFPFIAVQVCLDLRGSLGERPDEWRELLDLPAGIQRVPVAGEGSTKFRVAHHRGVPNTVDRGQGIPDRDRVDSAPFPIREHPRIDLHVQMPVGIACPRRVMPDRGRLDQLDRHRNLRTPRADPRRRVLGEPADELRRGPVLGGLIGDRDVWV
jgi:hypothetical protein